MGYEDKAAAAAKPHRIVLDERARLSVTGVSDVLSFDEDRIVMHTVKGELTVVGEGLHIGKLSLDTGELCVEGKVSDLSYEEAARPRAASGAGFSAEHGAAGLRPGHAGGPGPAARRRARDSL